MPSSNTSASILGALSSYTLAGPPVKMIPFGCNSLIFSNALLYGYTSQYTLFSRTRRAISWLY